MSGLALRYFQLGVQQSIVNKLNSRAILERLLGRPKAFKVKLDLYDQIWVSLFDFFWAENMPDKTILVPPYFLKSLLNFPLFYL